jgi:hypothetical protein
MIKTISIDNAKEWAYNWQSANTEHCKAFLIPAEDLIAALKEAGIINASGTVVNNKVDAGAVRAYMAIDPSNGTDVSNGYGEKLLIVSTVKDRANIYRDIIVDEKQDGTDENDNQRIGTGIFDFTQPCPSICDENSPLFNPPKPKK